MKLEVGDIVTMHNPLGDRSAPITSIDGNKAYSILRVFHVKIWQGKYVYEYGRRANSTVNIYTVEKVKPNEALGIDKSA